MTTVSHDIQIQVDVKKDPHRYNLRRQRRLTARRKSIYQSNIPPVVARKFASGCVRRVVNVTQQITKKLKRRATLQGVNRNLRPPPKEQQPSVPIIPSQQPSDPNIRYKYARKSAQPVQWSLPPPNEQQPSGPNIPSKSARKPAQPKRRSVSNKTEILTRNMVESIPLPLPDLIDIALKGKGTRIDDKYVLPPTQIVPESIFPKYEMHNGDWKWAGHMRMSLKIGAYVHIFPLDLPISFLEVAMELKDSLRVAVMRPMNVVLKRLKDAGDLAVVPVIIRPWRNISQECYDYFLRSLKFEMGSKQYGIVDTAMSDLIKYFFVGILEPKERLPGELSKWFGPRSRYKEDTIFGFILVDKKFLMVGMAQCILIDKYI